MTNFYFCKTCGTVIAGNRTNHHIQRHALAEIDTANDMIAYGIMRDPHAITDSINQGAKMSINNVQKHVVYISKSGKQIATRRKGSRVAIQYEYIDGLSGTSTPISEQEYYRPLFADGIPDPEILHTFNSWQAGADRMVADIIASNNLFAIVTTDPDNTNNLLFSQYYEAKLPWSYGGELLKPYGQFALDYGSKLKTNASPDQRKYMYSFNGKSSILYFDLLAPRAYTYNSKQPYLTRVLITSYVLKESDEDIPASEAPRRFVVYELDPEEMEMLKSRPSFEWADNITQNARTILCSQS